MRISTKDDWSTVARDIWESFRRQCPEQHHRYLWSQIVSEDPDARPFLHGYLAATDAALAGRDIRYHETREQYDDILHLVHELHMKIWNRRCRAQRRWSRLPDDCGSPEDRLCTHLERMLRRYARNAVLGERSVRLNVERVDSLDECHYAWNTCRHANLKVLRGSSLTPIWKDSAEYWGNTCPLGAEYSDEQLNGNDVLRLVVAKRSRSVPRIIALFGLRTTTTCVKDHSGEEIKEVQWSFGKTIQQLRGAVFKNYARVLAQHRFKDVLYTCSGDRLTTSACMGSVSGEAWTALQSGGNHYSFHIA